MRDQGEILKEIAEQADVMLNGPTLNMAIEARGNVKKLLEELKEAKRRTP